MKYYQLKNERLEVSLMIPDKNDPGSRFDRMGMIEHVLLDQKHTFAGHESEIQGQGSGGRGFYNEFGIEDAIGYDDIEIGQTFLKIGVGYLERDSHEAYDFFHDYNREDFDIHIQEQEDSITLLIRSEVVNGYAVEYRKKISILDNQMFVDYSVRNIGSKAIETTEYCHNFININGHKINQDYEINFSFPLDIKNQLGTFEVIKHSITWQQALDGVLYACCDELPRGRAHYFEALHKPTGIGLREEVDFELHKVAIWGMPHVISPELFVKVEVDPNEIQSWQRKYTFFS